jgi:hypothetical protein
MSWTHKFIREPFAALVIQQNMSFIRDLYEDRDFNDTWCTNCERLDAGLPAVFMPPPDYMYVVRFNKVFSMLDNKVQLFRHNGGKTIYYVVCMNRATLTEADITPMVRVMTLAPPVFEQGRLRFTVSNSVTGSEVGSYIFSMRERVTAKALMDTITEQLQLPPNVKV